LRPVRPAPFHTLLIAPDPRMRLSIAILLVHGTLLAPTSANAQHAAELLTGLRVDPPPPAAALPTLSTRDGLERALAKGRRSPELLAMAGAVGGGVGLFTGMAVGALLDHSVDEDCIEFCFGPGMILGTLAGEALGIALGVHLANGRTGSLPLGMLASAAILVVGGVAGNEIPIMLVMVPVAQIVGAIQVERTTSPRP
jgi:hypothetical protein